MYHFSSFCSKFLSGFALVSRYFASSTRILNLSHVIEVNIFVRIHFKTGQTIHAFSCTGSLPPPCHGTSMHDDNLPWIFSRTTANTGNTTRNILKEAVNIFNPTAHVGSRTCSFHQKGGPNHHQRQDRNQS
jgi:hypothetical protein